MKRKIFLALAVFLLPFLSRAERVSPQAAMQEAETFFSSARTRSGAGLRLTRVWPPETKADMDEGFYIFNRDGGGFVFIAGDTSADAVLGYSCQGAFDPDDIPEGLRYWMEELSSHVRHACEAGATGRPVPSEAQPVVEIVTAKWGQSSPFNDKCPEYALAGCVPVAMAIVMRAQKWPDAGVGTLDSYSYEDVHKKVHEVAGYDLGYGYDWDSMPLTGVTRDNVGEIATLIRDCGVMVKALYSYTDDGTSSYAENILPAVKAHMKFDGAAALRYSQYSSPREWKEALWAELDDSRPVLYTGIDANEEGHAFVLDGYDSDGRFHINWGWNGQDNGYFVFPEFGQFVNRHSAIFGLRKDQGGSPVDYLVLKDLAADIDIEPGVKFNIEFTFHNHSDVLFQGQVAAARLGDDDTVKEIVSEEISVEGVEPSSGLRFTNVTCNIGGSIEIGDVLTVLYRREGGTWTLMSYDVDNPGSAFIPLSEERHLDEATSLSYDREKEVITLKTKEDAECSASPEVRVEQGPDGEFRLSGFVTGTTYTVRLKSGKESFSFEIVR